MGKSYQSLLDEVGWSLCIIAILTIVARCYCRISISRRFGWDDIFMVLALVCGIAAASAQSVATHYGMGLHLSQILRQHDREQAIRWNMIVPCFAIASYTFSKISMVLFCLILLGPLTTKRQIQVIILGGLPLLITNLAMIIGTAMYCKPREKMWRPYLPGTCLPRSIIPLGVKIIFAWNGVMDFAIAGFSVYLVQKLRAKRSTKWGLRFIMGGSAFGGIATIFKIVKMDGMERLEDITYTWAPVALYGMVEVFALIITGSLPTLIPLWSMARKRIFHTRKSSSNERLQNNPFQDSPKDGKLEGERVAGTVTVALREIDNMISRTNIDFGTGLTHT